MLFAPVAQIIRTFTAKERTAFLVASIAFIIGALFLFIHTVSNLTQLVPVQGGSYTEGIVGQPSFINPVLAKNGTPDKDLVSLVFADTATLAESIKHNDEFTVWNVRLKEGALWHDGTPITSDDIVFTIQEAIQNPDTLSPLSADWQNISVTRVSEREIKFELLNPYSLFEDMLKDLRPLPKKLFADLSPANFRLSLYNLEPIGSGPYRYSAIHKRRDGFIEQYTLTIFEPYQRISSLPYIETFLVRFYENEQKLAQAYNTGVVSGFFTSHQDIMDAINIHSQTIEIPTTKYFAVFFNRNANSLLGSQTIRKALSLAIDKDRIVRDVYGGYAITQHGPIPPTLPSYDANALSPWHYNPQEARTILEEDGWTYNPDTGIFEQLVGSDVVPLSITLTAPGIVDVEHIARLIAQDWSDVGVSVDVIIVDPSIISDDTIKTRNYQALLFGNIVSLNPDLFSFWHSSERFYPGLNFSLYQNDQVDSIIGAIRSLEEIDPQRTLLLQELQSIITDDIGALFLVSPKQFYVARRSIPGIAIDTIALPSDRLSSVNEWYVKTRRVFISSQ